MTQKRYQYWSSEGVKWTKWFETSTVDEQWQLKNKLKNEYRDVAVIDISPERIMAYIHDERMTDEKTERKILKHLNKFETILKGYTYKGGIDYENASRVIQLCKYLDDEMKELVINFMKNIK